MIVNHNLTQVVNQTISDWSANMRASGMNDHLDLETFEIEHLKETITGVLTQGSLVFQWNPAALSEEYLTHVSNKLFREYLSRISQYPEAYDVHTEESPYKMHIPTHQGGVFIKLLYRNLILELRNLGLFPDEPSKLVANLYRYHSNTLPWTVSECIYAFMYEIEVNDIS